MHEHHKHDAATVNQTLRDPVCGMEVSAETPHRHTHKGEEVLFCSAHCKAKFVAALAPVNAEFEKQFGKANIDKIRAVK